MSRADDGRTGISAYSAFPPAACGRLKGRSPVRPLLFPGAETHTKVDVDGFNLHCGALKGTPFRWLDPVRLTSLLLPRERAIDRLRYFTARVSGKVAPRAPAHLPEKTACGSGQGGDRPGRDGCIGEGHGPRARGLRIHPSPLRAVAGRAADRYPQRVQTPDRLGSRNLAEDREELAVTGRGARRQGRACRTAHVQLQATVDPGRQELQVVWAPTQRQTDRHAAGYRATTGRRGA